jgi:hypothetical protein
MKDSLHSLMWLFKKHLFLAPVLQMGINGGLLWKIRIHSRTFLCGLFTETLTYETDSFIYMHFIYNKNEPDRMDENFVIVENYNYI